MTSPKVSIIILNWNGFKDTIECLESLKKITYTSYQVVVVDNGSAGSDAEVLQDRFAGHIHMIKNDRNYGFTGGNNIGIRYALNNAEPDYLLLLNNDTVVDTEFLTEMVKVAESSLSIGLAGSKTYFYDDPRRLQIVWFSVDMRFGRTKALGVKEIDQGQYENIREVDYVQGSCLLIKRKVIQDIGLLDESYVNYWDETDYCFRARKAGYKIVYVPKAKIWHKVAQTQKRQSGFRWYYRAMSNFRFMKKHATKSQYRSFLLYFFGFYLWFVTGICLIYHHGDIKSLLGFYKGVRDGLLIE